MDSTSVTPHTQVYPIELLRCCEIGSGDFTHRLQRIPEVNLASPDGGWDDSDASHCGLVIRKYLLSYALEVIAPGFLLVCGPQLPPNGRVFLDGGGFHRFGVDRVKRIEGISAFVAGGRWRL